MKKNTHTFIVAIYTHYLANSLSPELPAVLMCNNIQTFVYDAFLLFAIQKRDRAHVSSICKTAFFHLKNISKLRPMLSMSNAETLIHAFMTSRLDYCNALLGGCSARLINKLQMVQNAAARVLTRTRKYEHISPVLSTLHWLPTKHRIDF